VTGAGDQLRLCAATGATSDGRRQPRHCHRPLHRHRTMNTDEAERRMIRGLRVGAGTTVVLAAEAAAAVATWWTRMRTLRRR
jgi:hypothetical protein